MAIKKTTTVEITRRKVNGRWQYFFRTAVPKDIGIAILGLNTEERKQTITWKAEKGKVVIEHE